MTIWQGTASFTGAGAVNSAARWVDVDSGPEIFAGAGTVAGNVSFGKLQATATLTGGGPSASRTNLFLQSSTFSLSPWVPGFYNLTAGQSDPQGGSNAYLLYEDMSVKEHYLDQVVSSLTLGVPYTRSIYVTGGANRNWVSLKVFSNPSVLNGAWARFNLTTGVFDNVENFGTITQTVSATNVGNGWWRISQTFTLGTDTAAYIRVALLPASGITSNDITVPDIYTGDGNSGVYIFGAQFEQSIAPTPYISTTTVQATQLDGSDVVAQSSLLINASATLAGGSGFIANTITYRAFLKGQGSLSVNTLQQAALNFTAFGSGSMLESTIYRAAPTISLPGQGSLFCSSSVAVVWKGEIGPPEPTPVMSGAELREATSIAQQILTALLGAAGTRSGLPGSTMASTIFAAQLAASENIKDLIFAPVLLGCFEAVRLAFASYESMDVVRQLCVSFAPLFPNGQWLAFLAEKFCLTEQAQILANTVFSSRAKIDYYIDQVNAAFLTAEDQAADEQDNVSYVALIQTHGAIVNDLNARERALPQMIEYTLPRPMPLLWIAQRISGNASNFQAIYDENNPINPLFMPSPVKTFIPSTTPAQP